MPLSAAAVTLYSLLTWTYALFKIRWAHDPLLIFCVLTPIHLVLLATWKVHLWPFACSPLRHLPEPAAGTWFAGHSRQIRDKRSGEPMNDWINEIPNDGLVRYRSMFNSERLFVTSPAALSEVLVHRNYDFAKPSSLRRGLGRILGVGLIVAEGEQHKVGWIWD